MVKRLTGTDPLINKRAFGLSWRLAAVTMTLCLTLFIGQAAAGGFALSGVGSKAINMGGAFRGLADDWSAAYWNPAGLTQIEQSQLTGMLVAINPKPEYTPNITYGGLDIGYRNGLPRYPNDKTIFIPDFSGFFKLSGFDKYTVGMAIFVPMGLKSEWDLYNPTASMNIRNAYPWFDHAAELNVIDFHPTIAGSFLDDKLSLGVGISFQKAKLVFRKPALIPSGIPIPHENLLIDADLEGTGWGYGANYGLLYKFNDKLQFGLSGKLGTTLKIKGTAKQELYTMDNPTLRDILLSNSFTSYDSARVRSLFAVNNLTAAPDAEADLKTPADIGFGLAYKPTEKLTFTADMAITYWSALDSVAIILDGPNLSGTMADTSLIMLDWANTTRFSFGAEYWPIEPLAIRLGYYLDPSPIPDQTFTPLIPDIGDKSALNIGAAFNFSNMELSYNYEYISFGDRSVTSLSDINGDGEFDNYPGDFKSTLHASHVSLTYRF